MKKFLFALTVLTALLLCGSVAMAAGHPCDMCGGPTTMVGSGSWCHWYCEACDYTTSRNHDPNSYYSGLVPDSCSGFCQWCGAAANYSSHTFTTWVYDGNATCTEDGTETAKCDNVQCWATNTRTCAGTVLGHDYTLQVIAPKCEVGGYTIYTCNRCGETHNADETNALGHAFGDFVYNGDGTHTAGCTRLGCNYRHTADCGMVEAVVGGKKITYCPICGRIVTESGDVDLDISDDATAKPVEGSSIPGRLMVLVDAAPLEVEIETEAFYMFITTFQRGGVEVEFTGKVEVTVDLNAHPFVMETSAFASVPPSELNGRAFKIVRVEFEMVDGKLTEVWYEMPFTLNKGVLTFQTEKMGTFLMVLNITNPPAAK